MDYHFIHKLLLIYKNKTHLSDKELNNILIHNNQLVININNTTKFFGNYPLLEAVYFEYGNFIDERNF